MKSLFTFGLLLVAGCAVTGQTSYGWKWTSPSDSVTSERIEIVTKVTQEVFEEVTGRKVPQSAFNYIDEIKFTYFKTFCVPDDPLTGSGECLGQVDYEDKEMWVTVRGGCLAYTSLAHELIHIFAKSTGVNDYLHSNAKLFNKARGPDEDTVEYKAKERAFKALNCTEIVLF